MVVMVMTVMNRASSIEASCTRPSQAYPRVPIIVTRITRLTGKIRRTRKGADNLGVSGVIRWLIGRTNGRGLAADSTNTREACPVAWDSENGRGM
jgi:hypothetical protein